MKQHFKNKDAWWQSLKDSASSKQQQILYLYVIPPGKRGYKKAVIYNFKVSSGEIKYIYDIWCDIWQWTSIIALQKNCFYHFHFSFLFFFFDKVPNIRNRILTNQNPELVIRNCQVNFMIMSDAFRIPSNIFDDIKV